jgi:lambda family phage portal protein
MSRDFAMNAPIAVSIFRRSKTNVIGAGLQVQPRVDAQFLGLTDEQADEFNNSAIREFDMWSNSIESDYTRQMTYNEAQALMLMSMLINGDVFFALPWIESGRAMWPYECTFRIIDADLVRNPGDKFLSQFGSSTNAKIRNGVQFNRSGQLEGYWVSTSYEDDGFGVGANENDFVLIPLYDDNGEQQIFQVLEHERINQRRGIPLLAPVVEQLKTLTRLDQSELMSALVASMFSVFVKDMSGFGGTLQEGLIPETETLYGGGGDGPDAAQEAKTSGNEFDLELGPATINYLDDDKEIQIAETRKKSDYQPFFQAVATQVSAAAEIPYDVTMLYFNKSYSALKGAANEAWKRWRHLRGIMTTRANQPVYENVLAEAVLKGRLTAPGFFDDIAIRKAWTRCQWVGSGQGQIDPLNETRAAILKSQYAIGTRAEEYAKDSGGRWDAMVQNSSREHQVLQEAGLLNEPEQGPDVMVPGQTVDAEEVGDA